MVLQALAQLHETLVAHHQKLLRESHIVDRKNIVHDTVDYLCVCVCVHVCMQVDR